MAKDKPFPSLAGQLLIALPGLDADDAFHESVILVCDHNAQGALGICINKPGELTLKSLFHGMDIDCLPPSAAIQKTTWGGPLMPERGFVLHHPVEKWQSGTAVTAQIGLATSRDIIEAIGQGDGPPDYCVALGYCGWSAGQLEEELKQNVWLVVAADTTVVFKTPLAERWQAAGQLLGIEMTLMSSEQVGNA